MFKFLILFSTLTLLASFNRLTADEQSNPIAPKPSRLSIACYAAGNSLHTLFPNSTIQAITPILGLGTYKIDLLDGNRAYIPRSKCFIEENTSTSGYKIQCSHSSQVVKAFSADEITQIKHSIGYGIYTIYLKNGKIIYISTENCIVSEEFLSADS